MDEVPVRSALLLDPLAGSVSTLSLEEAEPSPVTLTAPFAPQEIVAEQRRKSDQSHHQSLLQKPEIHRQAGALRLQDSLLIRPPVAGRAGAATGGLEQSV